MVASRLAPFGTTVFAEISAAARAAGAVDLGQGAPDFDGPDWIKEAAARAMHDFPNQYAPMPGLPDLRRAIADRWLADAGRTVDPDTEITITAGCTAALPACALGLLEPGDEVVVFEPYYDGYAAVLALAGARPRFVQLRPAPDGAFAFDPDAFEQAAAGARAVLFNTPHNPTGKVFTRGEIELIARAALRHDLLVFSDEVYEKLVYPDEAPDGHVRIATLDGMRERTVTLGSLGKTFSLTGWKIGWAIAPPELSRGVRAAHQFLNFSVATPLQHAAAAALRAGDDYYDDLRAAYTRRRDLLAAALAAAGFRFRRPGGAYFILADHRPLSEPLGIDGDVDFVRRLIAEAGVAAIPPTAFCRDKSLARHLVRFAFCKRDETLRAAAERLSRLRAPAA